MTQFLVGLAVLAIVASIVGFLLHLILRLTAESRRISWPAQPKPFGIEEIGLMNSVVIFNVPLPEIDEPHDVVTRELSIYHNGDPVDVKTVPFDAAKVTDLRVPQDTDVELELVDLDAAGNRSEAQWYNFTAKDTVPPKKPKEFSVEIVGEEIVSDALEEPEPEPGPVEEPTDPVTEPEDFTPSG